MRSSVSAPWSEDAHEAAVSRLYGGIDFPIDNEVGLALGVSVGKVALAAWSN